MTDIESLRALLAAASPGPWTGVGSDVLGSGIMLVCIGEAHEGPDAALIAAALIAAARNALPDLLDEIEKLRAVAEAAKERVLASHNYGCDELLNREIYECSCGHTALATALAALEAK